MTFLHVVDPSPIERPSPAHFLRTGQFAGFPIQDLKSDMRVRASFRKLPKLLKQMRVVLEKLGIADDHEKDA